MFIIIQAHLINAVEWPLVTVAKFQNLATRRCLNYGDYAAGT
jgi:hypothetical protein